MSSPPGPVDTSAYRSSAIPLPPSVPALIRCYEESQARCQQLQAALHRLSAMAASTTTGEGDGSTATAGTAVARVIATGSPISAGVVVAGRVVASEGRSGTEKRASAVVQQASPTGPTAAASIVAAEAAHCLLLDAREELARCEVALVEQRERCRAAWDFARGSSSSLQVTTRENDDSVKNGAAALSETPNRLPLPIEEGDNAEQTAIALRNEAALYRVAQMEQQLDTVKRENSFLVEKNTHLEGQLQRLLMSSMEMGSGTAGASRTAAVSEKPPLSSGDIYNKEALEKQIKDLQGIAGKLSKDLKRQTAAAAALEGAKNKLQGENAELKAAVLRYRRQLNDQELDMEQSITRKEEDDRIRGMEKNANRLREALKGRTEELHSVKDSAAATQQQLLLKLSVYGRAQHHLLRRLFAYQVRDIALRQCSAVGRQQIRATNRGSDLPVNDPSTDTATSLLRQKPSGETLISPCSPPLPSNHSGSFEGQPSQQQPCLAPDSVASTPSASSLPLPQIVGCSSLLDRAQQLDEIKSTFDRRVTFVEAQRRVEVQQLQALNRELRQALNASQEDLAQKTRLLERALLSSQNRCRSESQHSLQRRPPKESGVVATAEDSLRQVSSSMQLGGESASLSAAAWLSLGEDRVATEADTSMQDALSFVDRRLSAASNGGAVWSPAAEPPLSEAAQRYDPENMPTWEAVQVENEVLLGRLTILQEEKWRLTSLVEDLERYCRTLKDELKRNASTMNQLLSAGVLTPSAVVKGSEEGQIRSLQCLLQETLEKRLQLEEQVKFLQSQLGAR